MGKKRRHHYVWRYYLKPWSKDEKIWCRMGTSCFQTNLMGVGQQKDFYKLRELTPTDVKFLRAFIDKATHGALRELNSGWLDEFYKAFSYKHLMESTGAVTAEQEAYVDELLHNLEENLHSSIENSGKPYLEMALREDLSFFEDDDSFIAFVYYLCVQYTRTERQKSSTLALVEDGYGVSMERIWNVMTHMVATNVGWSLYAKRKNYRVVLLRNTSSVEFLTADQPIINTYAIISEKGVPPEEFDLYYPIAPHLSIYLTDRRDWQSASCREVDIKMVDDFNRAMVAHAGRQLYASKQETLVRYGW